MLVINSFQTGLAKCGCDLAGVPVVGSDVGVPDVSTAINQGHLSSAFLSAFTPQTVCVKGDLAVDVAQYFFTNSTISMYTDASITINANSKLTIRLNSVVKGCDFMWDKILAGPGSSLSIQASTIQDGENALTVWELAQLDSALLLASGPDSLTLVAARNNKANALAALALENEPHLEDIALARSAAIQALLAENDQIQTNYIFESNEKTVNEIYLNTIAAGIFELDAAQQAALENIVWQCPLTGGNAVYRARRLYQLENETIFEDDNNCNSSQNEIIHPEVINPFDFEQYDLSPNPSTGIINITQKEAIDQIAEITFTDVSGKAVAQFNLPPYQVKHTIDLQHLNNGIYFYKIINENGIVHSDKIIINR